MNECVCVVFVIWQEALQTYAFLVFVVVCLIASVFLFFILPETKNKTFVEISQSFAKINKVSDIKPSQEMEDVLSFKPGREEANGVDKSVIEIESSF